MDIKMTSMSQILNKEIEIDRGLKQRFLDKFQEIFPIEIIGGAIL